METHGGQDINLNIELKSDFSVTTNFLGPSKVGLEYITKNINDINHYPNQNNDVYVKKLINFMFKDHEDNKFVILGNGASELIDLVIRTIPSGPWKPGPSDVQFLEYQRSANNTKRMKMSHHCKDTKLTCIINPNNPTGDFMELDTIKEYILKNCKPDSHVIIDESMIFWFGEDWRDHSLVSQTEWIRNLANTHNIFVYIIHSWTKIFSCTGIRIGSIVCPDESNYNEIRNIQIPWSVNTLALRYLDGCLSDTEYLNKTWINTHKFRKEQIDKLSILFPQWKFYGHSFLSWIWIDTRDTNTADIVYNLSKLNGTPVRHGKIGYKKNTFIRIAVRTPNQFNKLIDCIKPITQLKSICSPIHINIDSDVIVDFKYIDIDMIKPHEKYISSSHDALLKYINSTESTSIPSIIVDNKSMVIIDGHHRHSVMKKLNMKKIPVLLVNYDHDSIIVNKDNNKITKNMVRQTAITGNFLEPKSTIHVIRDNEKNYHPIQVISPIVYIK